MAKVRQVNTFFWDDSYIEDLKTNEKLLFIYLITTPLTNIAGSFEISLKKICDHTGLSRAKVEEILQKFEKDNKFIYRNNWMLAVNAIEHQDYENVRIAKGIESIVKASPEWVIDRLCIAYIWLAESLNRLSHLNLNSNLNSNPNGDRVAYPEKPKAVPKKRQEEINTWLDGVAVEMGAKSRQTLAGLPKWRDVVDRAITEQRDLLQFLKVIRSEKARNKDSPQYFSPEACLKLLQTTTQVAVNGKNAKPNWQVAIEKCGKCDERGYIIANGGATVCKHSK